MQPNSSRVDHLVGRLVEIGAARLAESVGVAPRQALQVMRDVAHDLLVEFAGVDLYLPRRGAVLRRNARIRHEYGQGGADGVSACTSARVAQLARSHQLSERQVRTIVRNSAEGAHAHGAVSRRALA